MISDFNIDKLNNFLKNLYIAIGIRFSVFDDEFNLVTEYPPSLPAYCSLIRTTSAGTEGCRKCDIHAFNEAKKRRQEYTYTCHAGLIEAVAPIKLDGGILGYVILSQMIAKDNYDEALNHALSRARNYGLDEEAVLPLLKKLKPLSREKINAGIDILNAVVAYLQVTDLVKWKNEHIASKITSYIEQNLNNSLSTKDICRDFLISRTKLHQISIDSFGMSISKYILFKRLEAAKALLESNLTITKVADKTGFSDYNYFGKVFKKEFGKTPSEYKKSLLLTKNTINKS